MQLRYDEDFIEAAVFFCSRGGRVGVPRMQVARFECEREKNYGILDPDERNAAFFRLHLAWFREWGLEASLAACLREFPLLGRQLNALAIRKTPSRQDEGAELFVNAAGERTGLLALRVERFRDDAALHAYLRHEFTHLHDMLNPAFGYSPDLELAGANAAQKRLARERYRLLWDITIDGRLAAAGHLPSASREQHAAGFARSYAFWPADRRDSTFSGLWGCAAPAHRQLLALIDDPRGLRDTHLPLPGAACPLCDFPTFNWADMALVSGAIQHRISAEFPAWQPENGLCYRCLETYHALAGAGLLDVIPAGEPGYAR